MRKHFSTIIALGVALAFIVLIGLSICITDALSASDSDDQCDYVPPPGFEWEGELNPDNFDKWEVVSVQATGNPFLVYTFYKNPDETSRIETVVALIEAYEGTLLGYRYFKDGQPYSFGFNTKENKYIEHHFTPEERKGCMECHQDKLIVQETT